MRRFANGLLRLIFSALICLSAYLLLVSPITLDIQSVPNMARAAVKNNVSQANDPTLKETLKLAKDFGVENKILDQLPQKYHYEMSYLNLYNLSVSYSENDELTAKNINLPQKNRVQQAFSYIVLNRMNQDLKDNSKKVKQAISIFHYFCLAAIFVFILAVLLVLFGKYWASIALLIAAVGSFAALELLTNQLLQGLQAELYKGISLTTSSNILLGLAISVVIAIIWPLCVKMSKKS